MIPSCPGSNPGSPAIYLFVRNVDFKLSIRYSDLNLMSDCLYLEELIREVITTQHKEKCKTFYVGIRDSDLKRNLMSDCLYLDE